MSRIRQAIEQRSYTQPDIQEGGSGSGYHDYWGQGMVFQGPRGTSTTDSMRLSAVFACLRLLSEAVATLPMDTFLRNGGIRKPFRPRPDYLTFDPPQVSRIDYLSQVMLSLLTDGNAYVLTPRDRLGVPVDLVVLDPSMVIVRRTAGRLTYEVQGVMLDPRTDLMHIRGMMLPGNVTGVSPIRIARDAIDLGLAAQAFGKSFFENGALPSATIEAPGKMSLEGAKLFADTWNAGHQGIGNAQKIGVLTEGAKLNKVSIAPEDAQFLQTRAFQVPDIARIFGVPPHLIADASNSTSWGSGLAEQNLAFGQFSLRPWTERIEEAHSRLLTSHGLPMVFVKLNLDALLRASIQDRYATYKIGVEAQIDTINECRAKEDKPPVPWGDEPYVVKKISETGPAPPDLLDEPAGGANPAPDAEADGGTTT